jgi:hypothetical protein
MRAWILRADDGEHLVKTLREKITLDGDSYSGVSIPVVDDGCTKDPTASFHLDEEVVVVNAQEFDRTIEAYKLVCRVALGDLLALGMPAGVSTGRLLRAAIEGDPLSEVLKYTHDGDRKGTE